MGRSPLDDNSIEDQMEVGQVKDSGAIQITDFSQNNIASQPKLEVVQSRQATPSAASSTRHSVAPSIQPSMRGTKKLGDRHTRNMHMKRRAPYLYLNTKVDIAKEIRGNPFNQVLKHSLLEPSSARNLSMRKQSHDVSKLNSSLESKKTNLMRMRNLSINTDSAGLDCLSL